MGLLHTRGGALGVVVVGGVSITGTVPDVVPNGVVQLNRDVTIAGTEQVDLVALGAINDGVEVDSILFNNTAQSGTLKVYLTSDLLAGGFTSILPGGSLGFRLQLEEYAVSGTYAEQPYEITILKRV
jgi:hypothetical protein